MLYVGLIIYAMTYLGVIQALLRPAVSVRASFRLLSTASGARGSILGRYTVFPTTLVRLQTGKGVAFREYEEQVKKGSRSYDFTKREDGLYHPAPLSNEFIGPNGLSLRPPGLNMWEILDNYKGGKIVVSEVPKDTPVPEGMVLLHEHNDHYSLQTTEPIDPKVFTKRATAFFKKYPQYPKEDYFIRHPIN